METATETIEKLRMLEPLGSADRAALATFFEPATYEAGDRIYAEGDDVACMYVVQSGVVDLMAMLDSGVEHRFLTIREGGVFGMLSLAASGPSAGGALVTEPAAVLALSRTQIDAFGEAHPEAALALWHCILAALGGQMRILVDDYRRIAGWARDVAAVGSLNLVGAATEGRELELQLSSGASLTGSLLKVDYLEAGTLLTFRAADGRIHIVPYHAVTCLTLPESPIPAADIPAI